MNHRNGEELKNTPTNNSKQPLLSNTADLRTMTLNELKNTCRSLNIPIPERSQRWEIVRILNNYANEMNLNKQQATPFSNKENSEQVFNRNSPPIQSKMTPISTSKPTYIGSEPSSSHKSRRPHKYERSPTPVHHDNSTVSLLSKRNIIILILIILLVFVLFLFC